MSDTIELAKKYFEVSNQSDMKAIRSMMTASTTSSSPNTGVFLGVDNIIKMQEEYHGSFDWLNWEVLEVEERAPGVVWFDFHFTGKKKDGGEVSFLGEEYVIIHEGKIVHLEIKTK